MNGKIVARRLVISAIFLLLIPAAAQAVLWENLQFEQISFLYEDPANNADFSSTGRCVVEYGKDMNAGFLNVVAEIPGLGTGPVWAVRNVPLMDETMGPPDETVCARFPLDELGVESGLPVADIEYGYLITAEPLSDAEGATLTTMVPLAQMAPVNQVVYNHRDGAADIEGIEKVGEMYGSRRVPFAGTPNHSVTSWIGCNMPNIPLNDNTDPMDDCACAPASCANSLAWLDSQHPEIDVPDDQRALLKQLSNLMNRAQGKGAKREAIARAKLDFIEAHNLPIHVKYQGKYLDGDIKSSSGHTTASDEDSFWSSWPTEDWLKSEAEKGEDVEMIVSYRYKDASGWHCVGAHAVVLSGVGTMRDDWTWVAWKHDEEQSTASGTVQETGILHDTGDGLIIIGMGFEYTKADGTKVQCEAYLDGVYSESYDPTHQQPPAEEDFDDYCEYITRTIKPGGSLELEFPTDEDRSFDVTVYQVNRNQEPPTQKLLWRWAKNSGKSRRLTNPTDRCITVKIHNDDMEGDHWWGYDDYTVGLTQTKTVAPDDPGNFEETGGFSLGGRDGYCEFGPAVLPSMTVDYMMDLELDTVPGTLGTPGGTFELFLNCMIPAWNKYWGELGFIVDVLEVGAPGDLLVECPSNGAIHTIPIAAPGRHQVILGAMPQGMSDFTLRLEAQAGLEITFDAIGVPTLVAPWSSVEGGSPPPALFLAAAQPNPFNPVTTIRFGLAEAGPARLAVYDLQGRQVIVLHDGTLAAGPQEKTWTGVDAAGREVAAGTYIYRLESADGVLSRKMTLVK